MTFEQFRTLREMEQIEVLIEKGVAIAESCYQLNTSYLYYLASFFVVVIYESETDELLKIIPLKQREKQKTGIQHFLFHEN